MATDPHTHDDLVDYDEEDQDNQEEAQTQLQSQQNDQQEDNQIKLCIVTRFNLSFFPRTKSGLSASLHKLFIFILQSCVDFDFFFCVCKQRKLCNIDNIII